MAGHMKLALCIVDVLRFTFVLTNIALNISAYNGKYVTQYRYRRNEHLVNQAFSLKITALIFKQGERCERYTFEICFYILIHRSYE